MEKMIWSLKARESNLRLEKEQCRKKTLRQRQGLAEGRGKAGRGAGEGPACLAWPVSPAGKEVVFVMGSLERHQQLPTPFSQPCPLHMSLAQAHAHTHPIRAHVQTYPHMYMHTNVYS